MCLNDCVLPEDVLNEAEQASNSLIPEKSKGRSGQVRSGQVRSGQVRSGQVRSGHFSYYSQKMMNSPYYFGPPVLGDPV
jgi:hypothetical protein